MDGSKILHQTVVKHAKQKEQKISIIETQTNEKVTYFDLLSDILGLQNFLGSKPQTIILATPGGIINSVIWLTSLIFGHILIPISPNITEFEYKELVSKHTPNFIITETEKWVTTSKIKQLTLAELQSNISKNRTFPKVMHTIRDGKVYLETSGSTGAPKGMLLTATQIVITADNIRKNHELTEHDRGLTPLPFYHVNAPVVSLVASILAGSTIIIAPKFSASHFWNWVEKYDPTWISIVPTIVAILLKFDKPKFLNKSSIRFVRTASAPLPKANLLRFEKKIGFPIIETYGISEGASTIFSNPLPPKEHKPGSVGFPLGLETKIINTKTGKEISQGKIGEIYVKGQQVIDHYEEGREPESFENGWFKTGDLGYSDKEGYLFLTGRKKDDIIRGGENIMPREIEEVLLTYPGLLEGAVVGQPDEILGEKVVAFLVPEEIKEGKLEENIKKFAATKLSPQKIPANIYILDELPRGRTNKIDKNALRKFTPSK